MSFIILITDSTEKLFDNDVIARFKARLERIRIAGHL